MDSLDFKGKEMQNLLRDLKTVNKWLGGNAITLKGIDKLLREHDRSKTLTVMDIGCGDGEMLRQCTDYLHRKGYQVRGVGIDFNENILHYARSQSKKYKNITFEKIDVFYEPNLIPNCDIALCTLFLHHFSEEEIIRLLKVLLPKVHKGLVINDLHRNRMAFNLFKLVSLLFLKTSTAYHDGLVSIARGFKKYELAAMQRQLPNQNSEIGWKWAFRFQWLIHKNPGADSGDN